MFWQLLGICYASLKRSSYFRVHSSRPDQFEFANNNKKWPTRLCKEAKNGKQKQQIDPFQLKLRLCTENLKLVVKNKST